MTNATARTFGHPATLVGETDAWMVLARPKQPTFGALVLICKESAQAFSDLSPGAFTDLSVAVGAVERLLRAVVNYDKINYLMLMMVDRHVHFHVIPRYAEPREWGGRTFPDASWPGPPDLGNAVALGAEELDELAKALKSAFSS